MSPSGRSWLRSWTSPLATPRKARCRPSLRLSVEALEDRTVPSIIPVGGEILVNTYTPNVQSRPAVAADAAGNFVAVWESDGQDGSYYGIFGQRFAADGTKLGNEFQVNTFTPNNQGAAAVAMDAAGNFVVVWHSFLQDGDSFAIIGQRYAANGTKLGGEFLVNTYTVSEQSIPNIAMDGTGRFIVTWQSFGQDGSFGGSYAQRFAADGTKLGGEFRANTFTVDNQTFPAIAANAAGNFVIVWHSFGQDGSVFGVYGQRYAANGTQVGSEFRVNTTTFDQQGNVSVGMDAAGNFIVAWQSNGQDGSNYGVYAQRFAANGTKLGSEFLVNTYTTQNQDWPSVAVDAAGNFVIAWASFGQDGSDYGVYAQQFDASGNRLGVETRLNTRTAYNQNEVMAAVTATEGRLVTVWSGPGFGGSDVTGGIYAQRFQLDTTNDLHGNTKDTSTLLPVPGTGQISTTGAIDYADDIDVFRFTATASGKVTLGFTPASGLNAGYTFEHPDSFSAPPAFAGVVNGQPAYHVIAGTTYYVRVFTGPSGGLGAYSLTLTTFPDVGDTIPHAQFLSMTTAGSATQTSAIDFTGDMDVFSFSPPVAGQLMADLTLAPGVNATVTFLNIYGQPLPVNGMINGLPSYYVTPLPVGERYYARVARGWGSSTGSYTLNLAIQADAGDTTTTAQTVSVTTSGSATQASTINFNNDVDVFRFTATVTGQLTAALVAAPGLNLTHTVLNSAGQPMAADGTVNSQPSYFVTAGQTYFVRLQGSGTGNYTLSVATQADAVGNTSANAKAMTGPQNGTAPHAGILEFAGDVDSWSVIPTTTGQLTLRLAAAPGSSLSGALTVFDANGNLVADSDDAPQTAQVALLGGQSYFVRVAASPLASPGQTTGKYDLTVISIVPQEIESNDTLANANLVAPGTLTTGALVDTGDQDWFRIVLPAPLRLNTTKGELIPDNGRATVSLDANFAARLTLWDSVGNPVVQSEGRASEDIKSFIEQQLQGGSYYLSVHGVAGEFGTYALSVGWQVGPSALEDIKLSISTTVADVVSVDMNGDGRLDLVTANVSSVSVMLGNGDGSFQAPLTTFGGSSLNYLVAADLNGDGRLDVAATSFNSVMVFLGNGDGTLQTGRSFAAGVTGLISLTAADVNGDGNLDLASAGGITNAVVFLGIGDGTFQTARRFTVGSSARSITAADVNHDGRMDLLTANFSADNVSVMLGNGDGTFQPQWLVAAGRSPQSISLADVNADGRLDLLVANAAIWPHQLLSVLLGQGDGTFLAMPQIIVEKEPQFVTTADVNADGQLDLITGAAVLLGNGDGTFQHERAFPLRNTNLHERVRPADVNGDGRIDLVTKNGSSMAVFLGLGDGTFEEQRNLLTVGSSPRSILAADLNGDGRNDLVTANVSSNDVSVLLSNGDGSFQPQRRYGVGAAPTYLTAADVNGDSRLDLITNYNTFDFSGESHVTTLLLGYGDGTFQPHHTIAAGSGQVVQSVADVNGDQRVDLVTLVGSSFQAIVRLGNGDGTFQAPLSAFSAGSGTAALMEAADLNGDGFADLVTSGGTSLFLLLSKGDGTFHAPVVFPQSQGDYSQSLRIADVDRDGMLDVVTSLRVLRGRGDGTFEQLPPYANYISDLIMTTVDLNRDSFPDLVLNPSSGGPYLLRYGKGDGTFLPAISLQIALGSGPIAASADFTGDGFPDLAFASFSKNYLTLLLNLNGTQIIKSTLATTNRLFAPQVFDWDRDGADDTLVVETDGNLLWRRGRPGSPGVFEAPAILNIDQPFRTAVAYADGGRNFLAAIAFQGNTLSVFSQENGTLQREEKLVTGLLPSQLEIGDLDGDRRPDMVVRNAGDGTLSLFRGTVAGRFVPVTTLSTSLGASHVRLADADGDGRLDLLVGHEIRGEVQVWHNRGDFTFQAPVQYRAGAGLYGLTHVNGVAQPLTYEATSGSLAADFTDDGIIDVITFNPGTYTLGLLSGLGQGRFSNPERLLTAGPVKTAQFADLNRDGRPDLIALAGDKLQVYLNDGEGGFRTPVNYAAGNLPSGLTLAHVNQDGRLDVLIGNEFGDVLVLLGDDKGGFLPYQRTGGAVAMAVADLNGDGNDDFVYGNQGQDRVSLQYGDSFSQVFQDRATGILAPGAVRLADLNGDGNKDLVVANSGGNSVLVYLGLGNGQFGAAVGGGRGLLHRHQPRRPDRGGRERRQFAGCDRHQPGVQRRDRAARPRQRRGLDADCRATPGRRVCPDRNGSRRHQWRRPARSAREQQPVQ